MIPIIFEWLAGSPGPAVEGAKFSREAGLPAIDDVI
jgi:hypothetical protein